MKTGIELIAEERLRQIEKEGWSSEHDDRHDNSELAFAGMVYCHPDPSANFVQKWWPFYETWYKPSGLIFDRKNPSTYEGRIRELTKAGALIAAEIDRLQRSLEEK